jgi:hypothetical protein
VKEHGSKKESQEKGRQKEITSAPGWQAGLLDSFPSWS